jgi:hypothetical protein
LVTTLLIHSRPFALYAVEIVTCGGASTAG